MDKLPPGHPDCPRCGGTIHICSDCWAKIRWHVNNPPAPSPKAGPLATCLMWAVLLALCGATYWGACQVIE